MTKTLALLGATGSIGHQTLQVARELGLRVAALTARNNVDKLEAQVRQFLPRLAVLYDRKVARKEKPGYTITGFAEDFLLESLKKGDNNLD